MKKESVKQICKSAGLEVEKALKVVHGKIPQKREKHMMATALMLRSLGEFGLKNEVEA